jgi:hypothetical protein
MVDLQAMLGALNQSLNRLAGVVTGKNVFGIGLGGREKSGVSVRGYSGGF